MKGYTMRKLTKEQAIKKVMGDYPGMTEAVAKYYVEEVLGYM